MKSFFIHTMPKWAQNLTEWGNSPQFVEVSTLIHRLAAFHPSRGLPPTVRQRQRVGENGRIDPQTSPSAQTFVPTAPWRLLLSSLLLLLTVPALAAYVPLTGVIQLWKGDSSFHSCALTSSGGVQCWGYNFYGQLGDNSTTNHLTPVAVSGLSSGVTALAAGVSHTCAVTSSGGVQCWGRNQYGSLGDNSTTDRWTPVAVSGLSSGVTALVAGNSHTCALTSIGGVQCWGSNTNGRLGDNSTTDRWIPVAVSSLSSGVTALAAGGAHTCAVTSSGGVKCWGSNLFGQLGDNSITMRKTPVAVSGLSSGVAALATGSAHTCALTSSGGVQCWGWNVYGQLGDNSTTNHLTPVAVSGLSSGVTALVAGSSHTCALTSSGGVQCWGLNNNGRLGDNSTAARWIPVAVSGLSSGMTALAAGSSHTCALTSSSGVKCWGSNFYGELGDNSTTQRFTPVDVLYDTPPTATPVSLNLNPSGTSTWKVLEVLQGNYTYSDAESDVESGTTFQWYQATDNTCSVGKTAISGATTQTYTVVSGEVGKYLCFGVTPKNAKATGTEVLATSSSAITKLDQTINFTPPANGTYGGSATLTATATSGLTVTFASMTTNVCTVSGTTVNYVDVGTCTVTADQVGNAIHLAAPQVSANWFINPPLLPDINVRQGSTNIPTSGSFEVGPSGIGHHVHYTLTIDNLGNIDLILNGTPKIRVSGANAGEFSVDDTATTSPIVVGTSTTFILTFIPTSLGNKTATLTIANNDQDEGNYTMTVTGTAMPHKNLQVTVAGSGQGMVTSKPDGVDCEVNGVLCLMPVIDAPQWVYLTAVPAVGSVFTGWSGDPACQTDGKVFIMADTACVATFELNNYTLTVEKNVSTATVTGEGLNCPGTCQATYLYGTTVTLAVGKVPLEWEFVGWSGSCDSQGQVTISHDQVCRAKYQEDPNIPALGDGNGDGILDAHQANVVSLPDKVTGRYVTFAVQPDTCVISDVYTDLPENYGKPEHHKPMPQGLIYFELACQQAQISLYYHAVSTVKRNVIFRKFGPLVPGDEQTIGWYLLPKVTFEAVMIGGKSVVKATYTLTDGELGDSTGIDGRIVDPAGIVVK